MARRVKSLKAPEQGYGHRDHRSKKRHRKSRVLILKAKSFKEKKQESIEKDIELNEVKDKLQT